MRAHHSARREGFGWVTPVLRMLRLVAPLLPVGLLGLILVVILRTAGLVLLLLLLVMWFTVMLLILSSGDLRPGRLLLRWVALLLLVPLLLMLLRRREPLLLLLLLLMLVLLPTAQELGEERDDLVEHRHRCGQDCCCRLRSQVSTSKLARCVHSKSP